MDSLSNPDILQLESFFADARHVGIVVHTHPDGDAIGSGAALSAYLRLCRGTSVRLLLPDPAPASLSFLLEDGAALTAPDPRAAEWIAQSDLLVCLDMNGFCRAGSLEAPLRDSAARKILIDHHQNPDRQAFSLVLSRTDISSASELLYWALCALDGGAQALPLAVLTPLMAGMTTDTNNFANSVFPSTLQMASALLAAGVDRDALLEELYHRYRENRFRSMGAFLSERLVVLPGGVAYGILDREFLQRFDLQDGETEGFVNLPLGIDGVRLSLFLKEDEGHFRVSLRSKRGVSASRLASEAFHGGGHECAAGGKLYFPQDIPSPADAGAYVESVAARFMRNPGPSRNE